MNLGHLLCRVFAILRIREPFCDHCNALQECWGIDMQRRLEELSPKEHEGKPGTLSPSESKESWATPQMHGLDDCFDSSNSETQSRKTG
jgi:hypothetical protein